VRARQDALTVDREHVNDDDGGGGGGPG